MVSLQLQIQKLSYKVCQSMTFAGFESVSNKKLRRNEAGATFSSMSYYFNYLYYLYEIINCFGKNTTPDDTQLNDIHPNDIMSLSIQTPSMSFYFHGLYKMITSFAKDTKPNNSQPNHAMSNDTRPDDTYPNEIMTLSTQTLIKMTIKIMTLCIKPLFIMTKHNNSKNSDAQQIGERKTIFLFYAFFSSGKQWQFIVSQ